MTKKTKQRSDKWHANRQEILEFAAQLWTEHGYHETSLEELAAALGHTKPYLFYHFDSKEHILQALLALWANKQRAAEAYAVGNRTLALVAQLRAEPDSC